MADETSDVWDKTNITSIPGTHGRSSQRNRICSAQGTAEGEPKDLDRMDEVLKKLVVVKVLDWVGPGAAELGQYLQRHIACIVGQGFEWLEDPKHIDAIITNRSKIGAKPQTSSGSKVLEKTDREALNELEEM